MYKKMYVSICPFQIVQQSDEYSILNILFFHYSQRNYILCKCLHPTARIIYRDIGNSLIEVSYSQLCIQVRITSLIRQINFISDRVLTEQKLRSPLLLKPDDISRKLLSEVTNQQTTSPARLWFTAYSLLPSRLRATHTATKPACDWPVTARSQYLLS